MQYSVFECNLDEAQADRLRRRIDGLIDAEEDSVRLYLLCGHCRRKVEVHGRGVGSEEDPEVYIV